MRGSGDPRWRDGFQGQFPGGGGGTVAELDEWVTPPRNIYLGFKELSEY